MPPAAMTDPATLADDRVRELAAEIVRRPEYSVGRTEVDVGLVDQLLSWLRELSAWLQALSWTNPTQYWLLVGSLVLIFALLMTHVVWSIRRAMASSNRPEPTVAAPASIDLVAEAEALAGTGRFLEAAHRLHLASIELLLRGRVLDLSRFETNRTLRGRLAQTGVGPEDRDEFTHLLDRLETSWFRDRVEDPALYQRWRNLFGRLRTRFG